MIIDRLLNRGEKERAISFQSLFALGDGLGEFLELGLAGLHDLQQCLDHALMQPVLLLPIGRQLPIFIFLLRQPLVIHLNGG